MSYNIKKQFQRVRQNIDQNLGRAEKSEVLNDEEQNLEKRVELLKNVCTSILKKLQLCMRQGTDAEKKMKKIPEYALSQALIECSVQLEQQTPSGQIFFKCGDAESNIAKEIYLMEYEIENRIMKNIQILLENDYPLIQKLKKQLTTKALDMDASKARYANALKQAQSGAGLHSKVDEIKNELEDNITKVDQTKDQLATEMYTFVSKEIEINHCLLALVQVQAAYHRQCLSTLERFIPIMQESIDFASIKPVFSQRLEEHLELRSGRHIAIVIEECVSALVEYGLEEEGLFRLAGSTSKIKKLKAAFNSNISSSNVISMDEDIDVHVVASILKLYLRELPEPLLCSNLYTEWMLCVKEQNEAKRINMLKEVIKKMPQAYQNNLRYIIRFLAKLAEYSDVNKMTPSNIGLVMGPNLLWPPGDSGPNMLTTGLLSNLAENLIKYALILFPGDIDFSYGAGRISNLLPDVSSSIESSGYSIHSAFPVNQSDLITPTKFTTLPAYNSQDLSYSTKPKNLIKDLPIENNSEVYQSNTLKKTSSKKHPAPNPPILTPSLNTNHLQSSDFGEPPKISSYTNVNDKTTSISNISPSVTQIVANKPVTEIDKSVSAQQKENVSKQISSENNASSQHKETLEIRTAFSSSQDNLDVIVPNSKDIEKPRVAPPERPNLPPPEKPKKPDVMEKHVSRDPEKNHSQFLKEEPLERISRSVERHADAKPNLIMDSQYNADIGENVQSQSNNKLYPALSNPDTFLKTHNRQASAGSIQRPPRPLPPPKNRDSKTIE